MTCDWGFCDDTATGHRPDPESGDLLPVCARHGIYIARIS